MDKIMLVPVWHFILWTFAYALLGAGVGYVVARFRQPPPPPR